MRTTDQNGRDVSIGSQIRCADGQTRTVTGIAAFVGRAHRACDVQIDTAGVSATAEAKRPKAMAQDPTAPVWDSVIWTS